MTSVFKKDRFISLIEDEERSLVLYLSTLLNTSFNLISELPKFHFGVETPNKLSNTTNSRIYRIQHRHLKFLQIKD